MKKIRKFIIKNLLKNNYALSSALIETTKNLDIVHNKNHTFFSEMKSESKEKLGYCILDIIPMIYSKQNYENPNLKQIDFMPFINMWESFKGSHTSFFKNIIITSELNKDKINFSVLFKGVFLQMQSKVKLTEDKLDLENSDLSFSVKHFKNYRKDEIISKKEVLSFIKDFNAATKKSIEFYDDLVDVFKGESVKEFVNKYKENREIIIATFIFVPYYVKEKIYTEMEKIEKTIILEDILSLCKTIAKGKEREFVFAPTKSIEEKIIQNLYEEKDNFLFIKKLFEYSELKNKLPEKVEATVRKNKI